MRQFGIVAFALAALVVSPTITSADVHFATLDRVQRANQIGLDTAITQPRGGDDIALRTEPYLIQTLRDFGVYGQLPISHYLPAEGDADSALGNLEVGAFFPAAFGGAATVLRVGLVLPTARAKGDNGRTLGANVWPRLTDYIGQIPDSTAVRVSLSPIAHSGAFYFRGDFGADLRFGEEGEDESLIFRANLGVGARVSQVRLALEMTNLGNVDVPGADGFAQTLGVGIGHGILQASVVSVLEDGMDDWIVTIGLCARQRRLIGGSGRWR